LTTGGPELPAVAADLPARAGAAGGGRAVPWSLVRAGLVVAPAMAVANGLNYAYSLAMARLLGPSGYGALGALLALVVIGTVPGYALQAVVARHTALRAASPATPARGLEAGGAAVDRAVAELWSRTLATVTGVGVALGLATVAAGPWLSGYLRLGSLAPTVWLAAAVAPLPVLAAVQGMLQGRERFAGLAAVLLSAAAGKLAAGVTLVEAGAGVSGALAGAAAGSLAALLLALAWVRPTLVRARRHQAPAPAGTGATRLLPWRLGREVVAAAVAILGLLLLANVDVLLARHYLDAPASGLYAAGAVVAKIAYWAPQFVVTIVFPRLCTSDDHRRLLGRAAAAIAGFGGLLVAAAAAAPHLAATLPFGQAYLAVGPVLPLFAALGTCLALVQLMLFSGIATADPRLNRVLLAAVVAEIGVSSLLLHGSVVQIVGVALAAAAAMLAVGWLVERRPGRP
jgi:O-antigen/teichoic acid export membrane protein